MGWTMMCTITKSLLSLSLSLAAPFAFAKDEPATKVWRSTRDHSLYIRYPSCWKDSPGSRAFDAGEVVEFQPVDKCKDFTEGQWKISFCSGSGCAKAFSSAGIVYKSALPAGVTLRRVDSPTTSVWNASFACKAGAAHAAFSGNLAVNASEARTRVAPTSTLLSFLKMVGCDL